MGGNEWVRVHPFVKFYHQHAGQEKMENTWARGHHSVTCNGLVKNKVFGAWECEKSH